ncbi:AAA family ATPase [Bifidobacterium dentium]|uniref:AAA family ATPase n=1 Tax=Bifidobacterium dentium TaxID=1689 RepID=UPI0018B02768|nr:AAA family ATPase [Bifidobacterium dentium]MBF9667578.1 AAA family ATPase [Bifidobacterium dentium]
MEEIEGIKVSGRIYGSGKDLEIFKPNKPDNPIASWCTIFGKNGSGKTTLSKALWNYSHSGGKSLEADSPQASLNPENSISPENCYVFNEDFINQRVRFDQDNLGAVVSLGTQGDAQDEIRKNENALEAKQNAIDILKWNIDGIKSESHEQDNDNSLAKQRREAENNLLDAFKGDNHWAGYIKRIRGNRQNASVGLQNIKRMYLENDLTDTPDFEEFRSRLEIFERTATLKKLETINKSFLKDYSRIIDAVFTVLTTTPTNIGNANLSSIIDLIKKAKTDKTKEFFKSNPSHCLLCLQEINQDWKKKVLEAIDFLDSSQESEQIIQQTKKIHSCILNYEKVVLTISEHEILKDSDNIATDIKAFGDMLEAIQQALEKKMNSPSSIITLRQDIQAKEIILQKFKKFENNLNSLNCKIIEQNNQIDEHTREAASLEQMISEVSLSDNKILYIHYNEISKIYDEKREELEKNIEELENIQKNLDEAKDKLRRINIQMNHINSALSLIFLDSDRLYLRGTSSGEYGIYVKGKQVSLSNLSAGEKNAIALSYFFSMPYENRSKEYFSKNSSLFVLDDPISSLDRNNEIGIYSLIEHEILEIIKNTNTNNNFVQVIALTHSLPVYYALEKVADTVFKKKKNRPSKTISRMLKNGMLYETNMIDYNYRDLIKEIYDFAKSDLADISTDPSSYDGIANKLRRVLEEYSYFNFDIGGTGLPKNELVNKYLDTCIEDRSNTPDKIHRRTKNMITRALVPLWMNSESHGEEKVKSGSINHNIQLLDPEETQKCARLMLLLLNLLHATGLPGLMYNQEASTKMEGINQQLVRWDHEFAGL